MNPLSSVTSKRRMRSARAVSERILNPAERGMLLVLDLDPVPEPAAAISALAMLGDHPSQSHQAGVAKQVRADLALREIGKEDAVDTAGQGAGPASPCAC